MITAIKCCDRSITKQQSFGTRAPRMPEDISVATRKLDEFKRTLKSASGDDDKHRWMDDAPNPNPPPPPPPPPNS